LNLAFFVHLDLGTLLMYHHQSCRQSYGIDLDVTCTDGSEIQTLFFTHNCYSTVMPTT